MNTPYPYAAPGGPDVAYPPVPPVPIPLADVSEVVYEIVIAELAAQNLVQAYHRLHKADLLFSGGSLVFGQLRKTPDKSAIQIVKFRYNNNRQSTQRILEKICSSASDFTIYVVNDEKAANRITNLLFSGRIDEMVRKTNISVVRNNIYIEFFRPKTVTYY
ncbi:hypothetical protein BJ085DRAFT_31114 [Dimargaris cristalligena]|uniref:Uncharacterized protein n=1 Tax=Dimargaris cristalligena TaxID=215637 RepID=A0A4P9ZZQ6_9FUNG|nr:hypothetical protein BJ085DRAFT_31114 [Dimargaris cristalligena]|eukprot:RKP38320.1 hypothetical protein BJ085DRAFT_31114 [Dimargaris cristalligena]